MICHVLVYVQVPPAWCAGMDNCWEAIVDKWLSEEYEQYHAVRSRCRAMMQGSSHKQGPTTLKEYAARYVRGFHFVVAMLTSECIISYCCASSCRRGSTPARSAPRSRHMPWHTRARQRTPTSSTTRRTRPRHTATRACTGASASTRRWRERSMGQNLIRAPLTSRVTSS